MRTANAICAHCSDPFYVRPSRLALGQGITCSLACRDASGASAAKTSAKLKGRPKSDEHRKNISLSKIGRFTGEDNPNWRGGRITRPDGYVMAYAPDHPHKCGNSAHVLEHRLVMEAALGRYLSPEETVHHINGNPNDNRISNLALFPNHGEHVKYEAAVKREMAQ